jgi:hypothetical protein
MSGLWGSASHGLSAAHRGSAGRVRPATTLLQLGCGRPRCGMGGWRAAAAIRGHGIAGRSSAAVWHKQQQLAGGKTNYKDVECNRKTQTVM